jgi:hypothetical protein
MPKKTFTAEQIVGKLRQIEVLVSQGKTAPVACREAGIVVKLLRPYRVYVIDRRKQMELVKKQ